MKISTLINLMGTVLIAGGVAVVIYGSHVRRINSTVQAQPLPTASSQADRPVITNPSALQGDPEAISVPSVGISNPIIPGIYNKNSRQWTLTLDKVQHAQMTYPPNDQGGLTFMYGHNRREVFSNLPKIQPGALATVTTTNNLTFVYRYTGSQTTVPEDTSVFNYSGPPKLVLQTCTGVFFQNRQLFTFELVRVENHG